MSYVQETFHSSFSALGSVSRSPASPVFIGNMSIGSLPAAPSCLVLRVRKRQQLDNVGPGGPRSDIQKKSAKKVKKPKKNKHKQKTPTPSLVAVTVCDLQSGPLVSYDAESSDSN